MTSLTLNQNDETTQHNLPNFTADIIEPNKLISSQTTITTPSGVTKLKDRNMIDVFCPISNAQIHEKYSCSLFNVTKRNNKFYILQVLKDNEGDYYLYIRYGANDRIGGTVNCKPCKDEITAVNLFKKQFKLKTDRDWSQTNNGDSPFQNTNHYAYSLA